MQCVMLMEVELFPQYLLVIDHVSSMSVRFIEPTISYTKELKSLVYVFSSISIVFVNLRELSKNHRQVFVQCLIPEPEDGAKVGRTLVKCLYAY
jgi:hypothetical protein